jgi:hypothetical protein
VVSDYWVDHRECFLLICGLFFLEQFSDRCFFYRQICKVGFSDCSCRIVLRDRRGVAGYRNFQIGCHLLVIAVAGFMIVRSDWRKKEEKQDRFKQTPGRIVCDTESDPIFPGLVFRSGVEARLSVPDSIGGVFFPASP